MKKIHLLVVFFIFLLGYFLRVMNLSQGALTFGYDQARDAVISQSILKGDLKIQGPPASTPGLYHGVFYYYVLAPGYLIGKGSPMVAAYWIALLNALVVFIVFYLTFLLTKKVTPAVIASLLFAISFESTQYATWLSNPTIAIWTVPLMYLGLWAWLKEKKSWGPVVAGLGLGLSIQAEIFLLYHAVPLGIWILHSRKFITFKNIILFLATLVLSVLTMIASEIKFGFGGISGARQLALAGGDLAYAKSVGDYLVLYLNQIGRIFSFNSYPGNIGYGGVFVIILGLLAALSFKKSKELSWGPFLASWLFSHITVVTVGGVSTPFLMVGIGPAVSILLAVYLSNWWQKGYKAVAIFVLAVLVFGSLATTLKENPRGSTLFAIQKDMLLAKQLQAIDYSYNEAKGEKFSINTLTSPLWINIVWDYLYKWYGQEKYGYLPEWHGRDQVGQLGQLPATQKNTKLYFLILEPMAGIPIQYLDQTISEEDSKSKLLDERYFGELRIQKRQRL